MIRNNDGAVVAEQLAPYLDPNDGWLEREDDAHVDEAFVTPVLTRFNGRAEVTDEGDIVYVFDDLRSTSGGATGMTAVGDFLEEQETGSLQSPLLLSPSPLTVCRCTLPPLPPPRLPPFPAPPLPIPLPIPTKPLSLPPASLHVPVPMPMRLPMPLPVPLCLKNHLREHPPRPAPHFFVAQPMVSLPK